MVSSCWSLKINLHYKTGQKCVSYIGYVGADFELSLNWQQTHIRLALCDEVRGKKHLGVINRRDWHQIEKKSIRIKKFAKGFVDCYKIGDLHGKKMAWSKFSRLSQFFQLVIGLGNFRTKYSNATLTCILFQSEWHDFNIFTHLEFMIFIPIALPPQ